jgi:exopolysaccharide biosynthesis WecB/TagA/CpsF family protein
MTSPCRQEAPENPSYREKRRTPRPDVARTPQQKAVLQLVRRMRIVHSVDEERQLLREIAEDPHPRIVSFLNAHAVNLCWDSQNSARAFAASDLLLRDGVGMSLLLAGMGEPPGRNMNGTDLIPRLLDELKGAKLAVWGSLDTCSAKAANLLREKGHTIVSVEDGFQADDYYLQCFSAARPEVLLLGMGMPRQEFLAQTLKDAASHPCMIINGGAIIDFMSGRARRAPQWVRRLCCEWLYRLSREPKRLAKRYLAGNAIFLMRSLLLVRNKSGNAQISPETMA